MGSGSSKEQQQLGEGEGPLAEQREEEAVAASTGSLPMLRTVFSRLSREDTGAIPTPVLEDIFSLNLLNVQSESSSLPECFCPLLANLGPSLVGLFFGKDDHDPGVRWLDFLRGYNRCCGRVSASTSLNILFRLYSTASRKTENSVNLEFDSDEDECKITGVLKLNDVLVLLWICWIMEYFSKTPSSTENSLVILPDISHLVSSAFTSCNGIGADSTMMDPDSWVLDEDVSAQKLHLWILTTIPALGHCISQYFLSRLQSTAGQETGLPGDDLTGKATNDFLLTRGRAWAISLASKRATKELLHASMARKGIKEIDNLLYRSSLHGKGLSRFWFNVEGYPGPLLILMSAALTNTTEGDNMRTKWIVAMLTGQGVENKEAFYGSSGSLFALSPSYRVIPSSGKDKNFMYCHLRPTVRVYDPNPKPVGLAFGGTIGNERIFIDEDFTKVTFRHHAVDKTYQPGCLFPNQGFLATEASILDIEVWGLGGKSAKAHQDTYKKRESIFSDQRRKVDMKTFASWEDSPEKMMLDMVSDPNAARREDR